jgi:hypothetical protein
VYILKEGILVYATQYFSSDTYELKNMYIKGKVHTTTGHEGSDRD